MPLGKTVVLLRPPPINNSYGFPKMYFTKSNIIYKPPMIKLVIYSKIIKDLNQILLSHTHYF